MFPMLNVIAGSSERCGGGSAVRRRKRRHLPIHPSAAGRGHDVEDDAENDHHHAEHAAGPPDQAGRDSEHRLAERVGRRRRGGAAADGAGDIGDEAEHTGREDREPGEEDHHTESDQPPPPGPRHRDLPQQTVALLDVLVVLDLVAADHVNRSGVQVADVEPRLGPVGVLVPHPGHRAPEPGPTSAGVGSAAMCLLLSVTAGLPALRTRRPRADRLIPDGAGHPAVPNASSRTSRPSASRCSGIESGGRSRSTLPYVPQVSRISPRACAAAATAFVAATSGSPDDGSTSSTASIAPRPRTSPIRRSRSASVRSRGSTTDSIARAFSTSPSSWIARIEASAAAHAIGLPPNVPPTPPACGAFMISARPVTPANGSPPAMPFAVVTRSGTTPSCSQANIAPVRANPLCTSSATNRTPLSLHHAARAVRNPGAGTTNPPSPWIGSITTAAVRC